MDFQHMQNFNFFLIFCIWTVSYMHFLAWNKNWLLLLQKTFDGNADVDILSLSTSTQGMVTLIYTFCRVNEWTIKIFSKNRNSRRNLILKRYIKKNLVILKLLSFYIKRNRAPSHLGVILINCSFTCLRYTYVYV